MAIALIKLTYKQIIDASATSDFEKKVFHTSYQEFLMKSQAYNLDSKFKTFAEIKNNDGRANSLHYKLSIAVTHFIDALENKIPQLHDQLGNELHFDIPDFKLLASNIADKAAHKVVINYITGTLTLLNVFDDYLILCAGDVSKTTEPIDTFTLKLQTNLSISQYQEL